MRSSRAPEQASSVRSAGGRRSALARAMVLAVGGATMVTAEMGCGGGSLIDPRTLAEVRVVSDEPAEQEAYVEAVLQELERDACAAVEMLRSRDVVLDAATETQMLRAFAVARGLCAVGLDGFPVSQDALGQLSFVGFGVASGSGTLGLFVADDFQQTHTGLRPGDEACDGEWVSAPLVLTSSTDRGLRLEVPAGLRLSVATGSGFPGCGAGGGSVVWTSVRAGQILTVHALGDAPAGSGARLDIADSSTRGEVVRYTGNSLHEYVTSSGDSLSLSSAVGAACAGYINADPAMVVDFGPTPRSVELSFSTGDDALLFVRREDGSAHCGQQDGYSFGPSLSLEGVRGLVQIWTGSMQPGVAYSGELSVYTW